MDDLEPAYVTTEKEKTKCYSMQQEHRSLLFQPRVDIKKDDRI